MVLPMNLARKRTRIGLRIDPSVRFDGIPLPPRLNILPGRGRSLLRPKAKRGVAMLPCISRLPSLALGWV